MAEIELNVLTGQCLNRRIDDIEVVRSESSAWQEYRNNRGAKVNWQFTASEHGAPVEPFNSGDCSVCPTPRWRASFHAKEISEPFGVHSHDNDPCLR